MALTPFHCISQIDTNTTLNFDFNEGQLKEKDGKVNMRAEGVTLTTDRFGNENMSAYLHGHFSSYINLGTSELLKPKQGTISMWVKLDRYIHTGRGYKHNPLMFTRNSDNDDFCLSYSMGYDLYTKKISTTLTFDSTKEVISLAKKEFKFNNWHHLVLVFSNSKSSFYINGELQQTFKKDFETFYLKSDSVMIGYFPYWKNQHCSQGSFDDVQIFHRALTYDEVLELYNTPNPNRTKLILQEILKYGLIILVFVIIIIAIQIRNKRQLKRQNEQLSLKNKITELELKVVKAQMNPHFISNSLAAIQELVYKQENSKAGQYLAKFSYFLRQVLKYSDQNFITLTEELEVIKLTLELEQLRFKEEFEFILDIDKKVKINEVLIPSLITQPFIENAVWHGLLPLNNLRKPILKITIKLKNELPIIEIEDNGVGRSENKERVTISKGTQLVKDKIDSLNKLQDSVNYKLEIIDLKDIQNNPLGTLIRIQLDHPDE